MNKREHFEGKKDIKKDLLDIHFSQLIKVRRWYFFFFWVYLYNFYIYKYIEREREGFTNVSPSIIHFSYIPYI